MRTAPSSVQLRIRPRSRGAGAWRPGVSRDAMLLAGLLSGIGQITGRVSPPLDSLAYWAAGTSKLLYPEHWSQVGNGFLFYPPVVAQVSALLQPIGWNVFDVVWNIVIFGCFWYCAGNWSLPLVGLGLLPVAGVPVPVVGTFLGYALLGNMQWLLAALVVLALRHPSAWAVQVVTKTGPAVGALWHVFRGEWRAVASAFCATATVVAISFAFAPQHVGRVGRFRGPELHVREPARSPVSGSILSSGSERRGTSRMGSPHGPPLDGPYRGRVGAAGPVRLRLSTVLDRSPAPRVDTAPDTDRTDWHREVRRTEAPGTQRPFEPRDCHLATIGPRVVVVKPQTGVPMGGGARDHRRAMLRRMVTARTGPQL